MNHIVIFAPNCRTLSLHSSRAAGIETVSNNSQTNMQEYLNATQSAGILVAFLLAMTLYPDVMHRGQTEIDAVEK